LIPLCSFSVFPPSFFFTAASQRPSTGPSARSGQARSDYAALAVTLYFIHTFTNLHIHELAAFLVSSFPRFLFSSFLYSPLFFLLFFLCFSSFFFLHRSVAAISQRWQSPCISFPHSQIFTFTNWLLSSFPRFLFSSFLYSPLFFPFFLLCISSFLLRGCFIINY